jgi:hypothetical protein
MAVYTIEWRRKLGGGLPSVQTFDEGSTETFAKGAPVIYDVSEDGLVEATAAATDMLGIAYETASGTSGTELDVLIPDDSDVFSATISATGANSTAVHASTNFGKAFGLLKSTESGETTKWTVNASDTTNVRVVVLGVDPKDTEGTSGGRVLFRFISTAYDDGSQA